MCVPCEWVSVFCECLVSAQIPETHETHVEPDEIAVSLPPPPPPAPPSAASSNEPANSKKKKKKKKKSEGLGPSKGPAAFSSPKPNSSNFASTPKPERIGVQNEAKPSAQPPPSPPPPSLASLLSPAPAAPPAPPPAAAAAAAAASSNQPGQTKKKKKQKMKKMKSES